MDNLFDDIELFDNLVKKPTTGGVTDTKPVAVVNTAAPAPKAEDVVQAATSVMNSVLPDPPIDTAVALQKLKSIEMEIGSQFVEREDMIKVMMLSLISQMPSFFIGPPGTAKTNITQNLCDRIVGGNYFSFLFNKTSDPAEVFGPFSLMGMERDQFRRKTQGYLPEAHIFYGDEIWKANSPILNLLLPIINEREFTNDGKKVHIPLLTMFASSNEFPEDQSLNAIYDRFVFRLWVDYLKDNASKKKMLKTRVGSNNGTMPPMTYTTISIPEVRALNKQAKSIAVQDTILGTLLKLVNTVDKLGFKVSDRKLNQCLDILQVHALYSGRGHVSADDLIALKYVFYDEGINISDVENEILKLVDPFTDEINRHYKQYLEMKSDIDNETDNTERVKKIIEIDKTLNTVITNISNSINKAQSSGKDVDEYIAKRDEISNYRVGLMNLALGRTASAPNVGNSTGSTQANGFTYSNANTTMNKPF